ncbi:MAG: transcriptional regulator [Pseudoxanthomonas suwonensis]|nr:MAG: transcriptional regulator [Pseudoxanthomonas suwonensis]
MNLSKYFAQDCSNRRRLAAAIGVHKMYLWQIGAGQRRPSAELAKRIEEATQGAVTRAELRPDIFGDMVPAPVGQGMPAGNDGQHQEVA